MKKSLIATLVSRAPLGFVHQPAGPGLLRICPKCARWWALELDRTETDQRHGELHHFRCKKCDSEVVYSAQSDPRNLYGRTGGSESSDTR